LYVQIRFYNIYKMKKLKYIIILLSPLFCYAQKISDTTKIHAITNEYCYAGEMSGFDYCIFENQISITKKSKLIITGAFKCVDLNSILVSFCTNDTEYFVNSAYLIFKNDSTLSQLLTFNENQKNNFRRNAIQFYKTLRIKEKKKQIIDAKKFITQSKLSGLILMDYNANDESEYTDGTSMKFSFLNPTNKTIKYIWVNVIGLNAVNDPVIESGKSLKTLKLIGPIEAKDYAEYEVKYVWFSDLIESCKIKSIKVQYMDGSFKTITIVNSIIPSETLSPLVQLYLD